MKIDSIYRNDFPLIANSNIAYLDSGATSQKPKCVIDACRKFYSKYNANPYRGAYKLSVQATEVYNDCRISVANFLHAKQKEEIIFTKNATESLNLIAYSYGLNNLKTSDEVVLSIMEHHSSIVPWQHICSVTGAKLNYMYLNKDYTLDKAEIDKKITKKTKVVVISSVSNVLGTINDVNYIISKAHSVGAVVVVDISQSIAHAPFDVTKTDADFVVFSAHKMYGPLGIGVLYGKKQLLDSMPPFIMGGDMIEYVYEDHTTFAPLPNKFEAGTQNIEGAYGLMQAIKYIQNIGYSNITKHEHKLLNYLYSSLSKLPYITMYTTTNTSLLSSVISFNIKGVHAHDVASFLDVNNVCVRSGNHCAQPLLRKCGVDSTVRCSVALYNNSEDVDRLIAALDKTYNAFKKYIKE